MSKLFNFNSNFILLGLILILQSCDFIGKKSKVEDIIKDKPDYSLRPIEFVPVLPEINLAGGVNIKVPIHISPGFDRLVYAVDSASGIISLDAAGRMTGRFELPGVYFVIQNRSLDLLALGTFDSTILGVNYTLPVIYKISSKETIAGNEGQNTFLNLSKARIIQKLVYPFCIKEPTRRSESAFSSIRLNSIGIFQDNSFFVTSSGTNEPSATQRNTPNNSILRFTASGNYLGAISFRDESSGTSQYIQPYALCTFVQPPQRNDMDSRQDFLFTSLNPDLAIKARYISFVSGEEGDSYNFNDLPSPTTDQASGYLYQSFKFAKPTSITYSGVPRRMFVVTDSDSNRVYLFQENGFEGVAPPPQSRDKKLINISIGKFGTGALEFNRPQCAIYFNRILYVADAGNKRILRFQLTSDF